MMYDVFKLLQVLCSLSCRTVVIIACTINQTAYSQAIDITPTFRAGLSAKSFNIVYENDFFTASDRDYTQGIQVGIALPDLTRSFISRLLWTPAQPINQYRFALETNGYTPNQIDRENILYNDRPYASTLLARFSNTAANTEKSFIITNTVTAGIIGPAAGGKEIQTAIHRWIGYTKPLGWHNQVKNEPVINYQLNYEKKLAGNNYSFLITGLAMARLGNLSTRAGAGIGIMTGSFDNPFAIKKTKNFSFHFYINPMLYTVAYDATMQGGIFNRNSPYVIDASFINPLVFQNRFGIAAQLKGWGLEYFQSFATREYRTGVEHRTGGFYLSRFF